MFPDSLFSNQTPWLENAQWLWIVVLALGLIVYFVLRHRKRQIFQPNQVDDSAQFREIVEDNDNDTDEDIDYTIDVSATGAKCPHCGLAVKSLKVIGYEEENVSLDIVVTSCCNTLLNAVNVQY